MKKKRMTKDEALTNLRNAVMIACEITSITKCADEIAQAFATECHDATLAASEIRFAFERRERRIKSYFKVRLARV